jgi:hypothetical protein
MNTNPGNIIKVTARMSIDGTSAIENVFTYKWDALIPADDGLVMTHVAAYLEDMYSLIAPSMSNRVSFTDVEGFNHTQDRPMPATNWPSLTLGGSSIDIMPFANAALTYFRTGLSRLIGRKFWGGLTEGSFQAGLVDNVMLGILTNIIGAVLTPNTSLVDGGTLISGLLAKSGVFHAFTDGTATSNPATQRRRRIGRGA